MKKNLFTLCFILALTLTAYAQDSSASCINGKWKLISVEMNKGGISSPESIFGTKEVYQIFEDGGIFKGIMGDKTIQGTWNLDAEKHTLTLTVQHSNQNVVSVFDLISCTAKERVLFSKEIGTLKYVKE